EMSDGEIRGYQEDVLKLIALYVRDHRQDFSASKVFVNLLVAEGADIVVLARDRSHREASPRMPKTTWLPWAAVVMRETQVTGDVYAEYPDTPPGKPYKSIMVMPVWCRDKIVAAVSVDSSHSYHFDRESTKLKQYLWPYVSLLAWTLNKARLSGVTQ